MAADTAAAAAATPLETQILSHFDARADLVATHVAARSAVLLMTQADWTPSTEAALLKLFPDGIPDTAFGQLRDVLRDRAANPAAFLTKLRNCAQNDLTDPQMVVKALWNTVGAEWFPTFGYDSLPVPLPVLLSTVAQCVPTLRYVPRTLVACAAFARFICVAAAAPDAADAEAVPELRSVFQPAAAALLHALAFTPLKPSLLTSVLDILACIGGPLRQYVDVSRGCATGCACTSTLHDAIVFVASEAPRDMVWTYLDALAEWVVPSDAFGTLLQETSANGGPACPARALHVLQHYPAAYASAATLAASSLDDLLRIGTPHAVVLAFQRCTWTLEDAVRLRSPELALYAADALEYENTDAQLRRFCAVDPSILSEWAATLPLSDRTRVNLCKFLSPAAHQYTFSQCFALLRQPACVAAAGLFYAHHGGRLADVTADMGNDFSVARRVCAAVVHDDHADAEPAARLPSTFFTDVPLVADATCMCEDAACTRFFDALLASFDMFDLHALLSHVVELSDSAAMRVQPVLHTLHAYADAVPALHLPTRDFEASLRALTRARVGRGNYGLEAVLDAFVHTGHLTCVFTQGMALVRAAAPALSSAQLERLYEVVLARHAAPALAWEFDAYESMLRMLQQRGMAGCAAYRTILQRLWAQVASAGAGVLDMLLRYNDASCMDAFTAYMRDAPAPLRMPLVASIFNHGIHVVSPLVLLEWMRRLWYTHVGSDVYRCLHACNASTRAAMARVHPHAYALLLAATYEFALKTSTTLEFWVGWDADAPVPVKPTHFGHREMASCARLPELMLALPHTVYTDTLLERLLAHAGGTDSAHALPLIALALNKPVNSRFSANGFNVYFVDARFLAESCNYVIPATHVRSCDTFTRAIAFAVLDKAASKAPLQALLDECVQHSTFSCIPALRAYVQWLRGPHVHAAWCRVMDTIVSDASTAALALAVECIDNADMWRAFQTRRSPALIRLFGGALLCTHAASELAVQQVLAVCARRGLLSPVYAHAVVQFLRDKGIMSVDEAAEAAAAAAAVPAGGATLDAEADTCHVCFELMRASERVENLRCGHVFHTECLRRWFTHRAAPRTCPLCRREHQGELLDAATAARRQLDKGILCMAAFEPDKLWALA